MEAGESFDEGRPGDRLVVVGALLFGVGLLAALVTVVPFFVGTDPLPLPVYLAAGLAPVGLAMALVGMVRGNRARRTTRRPGARPLPRPPAER